MALLRLLLLLVPAAIAQLNIGPQESQTAHMQAGTQAKFAFPVVGTLGVGDVRRTVTRFIPSRDGGDFLRRNTFNAEDRPRLGYMDRDTASGRSIGSKSILSLPGVGRFEMAEEREEGAGLLGFSKMLMPYLELPPLKENYGEHRAEQTVFDIDQVEKASPSLTVQEVEARPFAPFGPSLLSNGLLPPEERPPEPFDSSQLVLPEDPKRPANSDNSITNPFDAIAVRKAIGKFMKDARRAPPMRSPNDVELLDSDTSTADVVVFEPVPAGKKIHGFKKKELTQLCEKFYPVAQENCFKREVAAEFVDRCRGFTVDCADFLVEARPLGAIANSFSSGVGFTQESWGISGIPYYPVNEAGSMGGGTHGKLDFGSYGGGISSNSGARDFMSKTAEAGVNWYEGVYGGKSGWAIPIAQQFGAEGGGGAMLNIPIKEGEFGNPITASKGYHVGPYMGMADNIGFDWMHGAMSMNKGFAVPAVGFSANAGSGVNFPAMSMLVGALDPSGLIADSMATSDISKLKMG